MPETPDPSEPPAAEEQREDPRAEMTQRDADLDLFPKAAPEDPPSWSPRDELTDSVSLVRRVQLEQDRKALEELMKRYLPRLERKVRVMMFGRKKK